MAAGTPTILAAPVASTAQAVTSSAFTPTAGALVLVYTTSTGSAAATGSGSIACTIPGMDASQWQNIQWNPSTAAKEGSSLYWAVVPASPSSGTVTCTLSAAPNEVRMVVLQVTGVNTAAPVAGQVVAGLDTTGTISLTLTATPTAADVVIGAFGSRNGYRSPAVPGAGFTKLVESYGSAAPSTALMVEYATGTTSTTVDASGMFSADNTGSALIVKAAAAAPTAQGSASGAFGFAGSAVGRITAAGVAAAAFAFAGSASGVTTQTGTAAGASSWAGTAQGQTATQGAATGTSGWAGTAQGAAPTVGGSSGIAAGTFTTTGTASGATDYTGTAAGVYDWAGTAAGTAPPLDIPTGTAGGTSTFGGAAHGVAGTQVARNITIIAGPVTQGWAAATPVQGWVGAPTTGNHWAGDAPTQGWVAASTET